MTWSDAIAKTLAHEGGLVNHPNDPGGITNYGISLRWLKTVQPNATADTIRALTRDQAADLYRRHWWEPNGYDKLPPLIGAKVFDLAVNMGASHAHRCLQRAIRAAPGTALVDDGILGPKTREAAEACDQAALLAALRSEAAGRYRMLAEVNDKLRVFLTGWLNRAYS